MYRHEPYAREAAARRHRAETVNWYIDDHTSKFNKRYLRAVSNHNAIRDGYPSASIGAVREFKNLVYGFNKGTGFIEIKKDKTEIYKLCSYINANERFRSYVTKQLGGNTKEMKKELSLERERTKRAEAHLYQMKKKRNGLLDDLTYEKEKYKKMEHNKNMKVFQMEKELAIVTGQNNHLRNDVQYLETELAKAHAYIRDFAS